ncbi:DUF1480 domain-containing protein, partial [Klebsiella pneumoniae]
MTTLKNNGHNWSYHNSAEKWGEAMSK